jgi:nucleotide-binding universal stress UspA family protein
MEEGVGDVDPLAKRILFATDFSDCSEQALQFALLFAKMYESHLDLLNVLEFQSGMDQESEVAKIYLDTRRKESAQPVKDLIENVEAKVKSAGMHQVVGIPADQVNEKALDLRTDLVVLGTHGWSGLNRVLLGSTAERVVRGAPCPVATVRWQESRESESSPAGEEIRSLGEARLREGVVPSIRHILIPVDFSECSLEAFDYAVQIAKDFNATVTLVHVLEPFAYGIDFTLIHPSKAKKSRESWESRLSELAAILQSRGITNRHELRGGLPPEVIVDRIREHEPDLVVMGTHGRRGFSHLLAGSVAEAILRQCPCPVLTVKSPKFRRRHSARPPNDAA